MNKYMEMARLSALKGIEKKEGGPFGAVIVAKDGTVISTGNNMVLKEKDPTAHAEIVAIRRACKVLGTNDLSGHILYTSCEPCPMCLSAIIWVNIREVYFGCTRSDADNIGFRDKDIYEFMKGKNNIITLRQIDRDSCLEVMNKYNDINGEIY